MIEIRRGEDRGPTRLSWLDSRHTFSFGHYYDPEHMGVSALRVINDDRVIPGGGFARHSHFTHKRNTQNRSNDLRRSCLH